jgi:hypothetical protein
MGCGCNKGNSKNPRRPLQQPRMPKNTNGSKVNTSMPRRPSKKR